MRNRDLLNRREFLGRTSLSLGAGVLLGRELGLAAPEASRITTSESHVTHPESLSRIGVQLYTVRESMRASVDRTLEQVAKIGFKEVEFAGFFNKSAKEIRTMLDANGLTAPSSHSANIDAIRNRFPQLLDDAAIAGHKYIVCASLPGSLMTADGYKQVAAEFNKAGEQASKVGVMLGFHNHDGDHKPLGSTTGFDILLDETDPKFFTFQMDLFWTVKGGKDPLAYFARYPGRFYSVHVKDMTTGGAMVDVGAGQLPFAKYFAQARQAGLRHYFVEHDSPSDPMASIAAGYRYLSALKS